jgi:hypothetical protein
MVWLIRIIIILIIYIPIIYLTFKRVDKNIERAILIILVVISLPFTCVISISIFPYYYLEPFEGKVIDIDTKSPISGAAVLAVYYKEVPSIAGSNSYAIDAQETLTNKNGEFRIPEVKKWFGDNNGEPEGHLTIFKPGYGRIPGGKGVNIVGAVRAIPEKYIVYELPKLNSIKERKENVLWIRKYMKPLYIKTINEERKNLGLEQIDISEEEIWK